MDADFQQSEHQFHLPPGSDAGGFGWADTGPGVDPYYQDTHHNIVDENDYFPPASISSPDPNFESYSPPIQQQPLAYGGSYLPVQSQGSPDTIGSPTERQFDAQQMFDGYPTSSVPSTQLNTWYQPQNGLIYATSTPCNCNKPVFLYTPNTVSTVSPLSFFVQPYEQQTVIAPTFVNDDNLHTFMGCNPALHPPLMGLRGPREGRLSDHSRHTLTASIQSSAMEWDILQDITLPTHDYDRLPSASQENSISNSPYSPEGGFGSSVSYTMTASSRFLDLTPQLTDPNIHRDVDIEVCSSAPTITSGHSTVDPLEAAATFIDENGEEVIDLDVMQQQKLLLQQETPPTSPDTVIMTTDDEYEVANDKKHGDHSRESRSRHHRRRRPNQSGGTRGRETKDKHVITPAKNTDGRGFMCPVETCRKCFEKQYQVKY
jgi:hypothetical protein